MTLQITDRDKKILIVLAVVVLVVGLGIGVLLPLMNKMQDLQIEIDSAQIEKDEKELKVTSLPTVKLNEQTAEQNLAAVQGSFYEIMKSVEIDKLMTEMAVRSQVQVVDLNIKTPEEGNYATLKDYSNMLTGASDDSDNAQHTGVYVATITMNMTGDKESLQNFLDDSVAQIPKQRVVQFSWQKSTRQGSSGYTLSMTIEIYMYENLDTYTQKKADEAAESSAEAATSTDASQETAEDALK